METWDEEADVVVIGFGGAGACAALEARAAGADVVALDRFSGGGSTAISGGVVYAGGGTHIQTDAGVEDDVEAMFQYLRMEVKGVVSDATLRDFCERSRENLRWLEAAGVPFEGSLCPHKTSYPTDDYFLYYSGNEGMPPYRDAARPAPRGHRAKGRGLPGAAFYANLAATARARGVRVHTESRATSIITHGSRAVGVEYHRIPPNSFAARLHRFWSKLALKIKNYSPGTHKKWARRAARIEERHARPRRIRARRGVILAAGGFIFNRDMVTEYAAPYRRGMPLGTVADDGSGIRLGESAGGVTDRMDRVSAWRFINPPPAFTHGILVDKRGERFVNEQLYGAAIGEAMVEDHRGEAILIIDHAMYRAARSQVGRGKTQWFQTAPTLLNLWFNARRGGSIKALSTACRMPDGALEATVDAYNAVARDPSAVDPLGKDRKALQPLEKPPFHAIDCSIGSRRFPCPTLTLGGLKVDEVTGAVLGPDAAIPGLYAAGRNAVGICSQQYVSGLSIADCVYSGRRAGKNAAAQG
jgi:3-oxo-5alpha-steroid 4-dehydrogenase